MTVTGERPQIAVEDVDFNRRDHPERPLRPIPPGRDHFADQWRRMREIIFGPWIDIDKEVEPNDLTRLRDDYFWQRDEHMIGVVDAFERLGHEQGRALFEQALDPGHRHARGSAPGVRRSLRASRSAARSVRSRLRRTGPDAGDVRHRRRHHDHPRLGVLRDRDDRRHLRRHRRHRPVRRRRTAPLHRDRAGVRRVHAARHLRPAVGGVPGCGAGTVDARTGQSRFAQEVGRRASISSSANPFR